MKSVMNHSKTKETKTLFLKDRKYDEKTGVFEGYASVFGNIDSCGDIIEPGAYTEFLKKGWDRVKILALHNDEWLPIGKPTELYEDEVGLYMKAKISNTSLGRDVRQLMKDDVLDELSIGYLPLESYPDERGNRHLTEIELQEVSVVTWAANEKAKILDVKSQGNSALSSPNEFLMIAKSLEEHASFIMEQANQIREYAETALGTKSKNEIDKKSFSLPSTIGKLNKK